MPDFQIPRLARRLPTLPTRDTADCHGLAFSISSEAQRSLLAAARSWQASGQLSVRTGLQSRQPVWLRHLQDTEVRRRTDV